MTAPEPGDDEAGRRSLPAVRLAQRLAESLRDAAGGSVAAVLLYGSHLHGAAPDRHSALDFVVIVDDYRTFYGALHDAGEMHRPTGLFVTLSRILPPNVIAFTPNEGRQGLAKCLVVDRDDLARALGPTPPDHFLLARMVQHVALVLASDEDTERWVLAQIGGAHAAVLAWLGPFLDEPFDAGSMGRRLLEICYRGEFRPEARNRADAVFETQRDHFQAAFTPVLAAEAEAGRLERVGTRYRFSTPPGAPERRRWERHFRRSKIRVTARWFKHVLTFDNWLPYVARKVERRTGKKVELTTLERRLPLIFLWPRAFRVLLTRPEREQKE